MFQLNLNFTHPLIKLQKLIGLLKNRSGMMTKIKCLNQEIALFRLVTTIKTNSTCLIRYALKCFFTTLHTAKCFLYISGLIECCVTVKARKGVEMPLLNVGVLFDLKYRHTYVWHKEQQ